MKTCRLFPAAALALLILLPGCRKSPVAAGESLPAADVRVKVLQLTAGTETEEIVGTVRPKLSAVVAAKVSGTVESVRVAPGQTVTQGELLAEISAQEIKARRDQALAVRDQAAVEFARATKLVAERAVSQQEYDVVASRHRAAQAAVTEAQTMLDYTKVVAPFAGVVARKRADVGDLATPGRPLFDLEEQAAMRVETDVPESLIASLKMGDHLGVRTTGGSAPLDSVVAEIAPASDAGSRTFLVKLDLRAGTALRSGQFVRVLVPVSTVNTLRIPFAALTVRGQMEIVFVPVNERAALRLIKTGKRIGDDVEVVSGLAAGESVVIEGPATLRDGQPLNIRP